jgi:hypothetical protein
LALNHVIVLAKLPLNLLETEVFIGKDDLHPTDAGQVKAANKLGPMLAPALGLTWKNL